MAGTSRDKALDAERARSALIIAALRNTLLTYAELGAAIDMRGVHLAHHMGKILDDVSEECERYGEPSLAALVVNGSTGEPGSGWRDSPHRNWQTEVRHAFDHKWSART